MKVDGPPSAFYQAKRGSLRFMSMAGWREAEAAVESGGRATQICYPLIFLSHNLPIEAACMTWSHG